MSDNEQTIGEKLSNVIANVTNLQSENPKLFYGGIGAILFVLLLLLLGSPSGEDADIPTLSMGSTYTVKNINGGDVLLTTVPAFSSADYAGEDTINICTFRDEPKGKLVEQRIVNHISYVRLSISEGTCQGKTGWTSSVNIAN